MTKNIIHIRTLLLLLAVMALLPGCQRKQSGTEHLIIVQTSDIHGAIFPYDFTLDSASQGSLAQVHQLVDSLRRNHPGALILLDNGDLIQGDPSSHYYNFIQTDSIHLFSRALNFMGYDAATMGNHDLEGGHAVYDRMVAASQFPWLGANILRTSDSIPYFKPYHILQRGDLKVAVLGLITPQVPQWLPSFLYEGMYFDDMVASAQKWADIIERDEQPDILIGLFHAGVDTSAKGHIAFAEHASAAVAAKVAGFDLILAGHDHRGWNIRVPGPEGDSVLILAPASRGRDVVVAELEIQRKNKQIISKRWNARRVSIEGIPPNPAFMKQFEADYENIRSYVADTLAWLQQPLPFQPALFGPSAAVDLIHKVQLDASGAQISFAASMSYEGSLAAGPVCVRDLFRIYRYENYLYVMELSGQEVDQFLEYACGRWYAQMYTAEDDLLQYQYDGAGNISRRGKYPATVEPFYNYSTAAGIRYTVDVRRPAGDRVEILSFENGDPFRADARYRVAINSYRAHGGGGHLTQGSGIVRDSLPGRIVWSSDSEIRSLMAAWFRKTAKVHPKARGNWSVVPATWHKAAVQRETERWSIPE